MKKCLMFFLLFFSFSFAQESVQFLIGQEPGEETTAKVFSRGFLSSQNQEHSALSFSKDGLEVYWSLWELPYSKNKPQCVKYSIFVNGKWTEPANVSFSGKYMDGSPVLSPDGQKIYFYSNRPKTGEGPATRDINIWYAEREGDGWGQPEFFDIVNTGDGGEAPGSFADNGNFYFSRGIREGTNPIPKVDIYISKFIDGQYQHPEKISGTINTQTHRENYPFIAPDESYIIFASDRRLFSDEGKYLSGGRFLSVSFIKNGEWEKPKVFNHLINGDGARFPSVSPDGRYLFFTRYTEGPDENYYWLDKDTAFKSLENILIDFPGKEVKTFLPEVVSVTSANDFGGHFSNDGKTFFFTRYPVDEKVVLMQMSQHENGWTEPQPVFGGSEFNYCESSFTGDKLVYQSDIPFTGQDSVCDQTFYISKFISGNASEPVEIAGGLNIGQRRVCPSVATNGNLYFSGDYDKAGQKDIYISRFIKGRYTLPENLGSNINSEYHEEHVHIAPDESYLLFDSDRLNSNGGSEIYISFKEKNGNWSEAINIGSPVNSALHDWYPRITTDEKYIIFTRYVGPYNDIFWTEADFIWKLKPQE